MKIFITGTPEVTNQLISNVVELLNKFNGELKFIKLKNLEKERFNVICPNIENINNTSELSFDQLFELCKGVRLINTEIKNTDHIVLLTSLKNDKNWFSASIKKDTFIDTNNWNEITNSDPKFGIGYQVVENIFQLLIGINYRNAHNHSNVHHTDEFCINEMCINKQKVIVKLKSADICDSCINLASEMKVKDEIVEEILLIINYIRENLIARVLSTPIELEKVNIDKAGIITIGSNVLKSQEIPKTLFVFFLTNSKGVKSLELSNHIDLVFNIYSKFKKKPVMSRIKGLLTPKSKGGDKLSHFLKQRYQLTRDLSNALNEKILDHYTINLDKSSSLYKINLDKRYVKINKDF
jgi:hypothetical protein